MLARNSANSRPRPDRLLFRSAGSGFRATRSSFVCYLRIDFWPSSSPTLDCGEPSWCILFPKRVTDAKQNNHSTPHPLGHSGRTTLVSQLRPHLDQAAAMPAGSAILQIRATATDCKPVCVRHFIHETTWPALQVLRQNAVDLARRKPNGGAASLARFRDRIHNIRS